MSFMRLKKGSKAAAEREVPAWKLAMMQAEDGGSAATASATTTT